MRRAREEREEKERNTARGDGRGLNFYYHKDKFRGTFERMVEDNIAPPPPASRNKGPTKAQSV